jgi:hypothetical protein
MPVTVSFIGADLFYRVSNIIQTPSVDGRIFLMGADPRRIADVVLYPDVVPFAVYRFDCCDLLQRSLIRHGTGKASGMM